jgi:hypothetical protein
MVLSPNKYSVAEQAEDLQIRKFMAARNEPNGFIEQCCSDREIQLLLQRIFSMPKTREFKFNNESIHNTVST